MANIGVGDIENFESKIRFALLVIPPEEIIIAAMENHGKSITTVTLEAWRSWQKSAEQKQAEACGVYTTY